MNKQTENTHIVTLHGDPVTRIAQESDGKPNVHTGSREDAIEYTEAEAAEVAAWIGLGAEAESKQTQTEPEKTPVHQASQADEPATHRLGPNMSGKVGPWPVYYGFPISAAYKRGINIDVCTHWQCCVTVSATSGKRVAPAIEKGIELAIKGLEKCARTPDPDGMRAYCLSRLRSGQSAIVPHPVSVCQAIKNQS